ncbi:hypothetical protein CPB84DRAFT_1785330 [Gymnopilus junonius]|uniref:Mitochondrial carrier protein n=1 Tax=Gymnopilus junonius TaxID=109634 RepID=A0A9P5NGJ2_GYMJU|nr:hypothetical protein CPB84DRAFT_1785330 [Gymnopilus junonius]
MTYSYLQTLKEGAETSQDGSIQAAVARTATRSIALYFARPVRLFRPAKVNGWQTLKNLAKQQGTSLTYQYFLSLVKNQGVWVIPKHFVPPMIINAMLGTILWSSYAETNGRLELFLGDHALVNAAISGGIAGACQAIAGAPAENVRIILEHGFSGHSWSCAWKEVFREKFVRPGTENILRRYRDIRYLRGWLHEVGEMAGRGWSGWAWGCGKDALGFAAFFLIFELSRSAASAAKDLSSDLLSPILSKAQNESLIKRQFPAVVNSIVLVTGGVIAGLTYEWVGRPWDVARRTIHLEKLAHPRRKEPSHHVLKRYVMTHGLKSFLKHPGMETTVARTRWTRVLRTAGRVGPWGVGFLVWEACNS